jgi:circadian clock protein KaiC
MNQESHSSVHKGIRKVPTGIHGFDEITGGGLPHRRTTLVIGGAGSGKTIFALQSLVNGAWNYGEPGIFVAFEETSREILANAATFGWDLEALEREKLFFLDAQLRPGDRGSRRFDLETMLVELTAKAREMKASRIVFDAIDVPLSLLDPDAEKAEIQRLHDWLTLSGLTGIVTAKTGAPEEVDLQRVGWLQFMVNTVVRLDHGIVDRTSIRELRVTKYRGSPFLENRFPMLISQAGIELGAAVRPEERAPASMARASTGIPRLDTMLDGGIYRGSGLLVTGSPGTAKSTLAATFARTECHLGRPVLFVSFDEAPDELVRNLGSVGIDLAALTAAGTLRLEALLADTHSIEAHLHAIRRLVTELQPSLVVLDAVSALLRRGEARAATEAVHRFLRYLKACGTTALFTTVLDGSSPSIESTPLSISEIADTWIHLSYVVHGGERNRALTIVKSRGSRHSNQVRELILSAGGPDLADVYTSGGEVLMGTARWEREKSDLLHRHEQDVRRERRRRELALRIHDLDARVAALTTELEARRLDLAHMDREAEISDKFERDRVMELQMLRGGGDAATPHQGAPNHDDA